MLKRNHRQLFTAILANRLILYFLLFLAVFSYFLWLNNASVFPDPDSFYHAKMVALMQASGPVKEFPWLPFTTLNDVYIDHHFLYHLLLAPLVCFFSPLLVIKLAAVLFAALAIVLFQWLLDQLKIKYSLVYTLSLLFSDQFIFRLNLAKAPSLSLIFIFLTFYFISQNKNKWSWPLFVLSFFYVWLYGGWPIFLGIGLIYLTVSGVSRWLAYVNSLKLKITIKNFKLLFNRRIFQLPFSIFCGLLAGLVVNPYFPRNLSFYWQQTFQIGLLNYKKLVDVGSEWYGLSFFDLIGRNIYMLILFFAALVLFFVFIRRQKQFTWLLFFLSLIFCVLTLKSQRNIEYFAPCALLFSALIFNNMLSNLRSPGVFFKELFFKYRPLSITLVFCFLLCLPIVFSYNFFSLKKALTHGFGFQEISPSASWLSRNSKNDEIIFHDSWADFPLLFYHNTKNRYLVGLDPTFMYFKDRQKYLLWRDIVKGKTNSPICRLILEQFNSPYMLIRITNKALLAQFDLDSKCVKVYEDKEVKIYTIEELAN